MKESSYLNLIQANSQVSPLAKFQDTEGDDTGDTVITMLQSPMQQCSVIISQQDQALEQFCFTKHSGSTADDHAAVTNVNIATTNP